ncbi:MAG: DUF2167 domain-containing protein [Akkermansiaceae bacterium]
MKKLITKSIVASLALGSWAIAQEASPAGAPAPAPEMVQSPEELAPPTIEEIRETFPSAKPAGETGEISSHASIQVQDNQLFFGGSDTSKLMKIYGNLPESYDGAIVADDESYIITFQFEDSGYVKDDEKDELDADDLLQTFKDAQVEANKARIEAGLDTNTIVGWATEPNYNESTNNLEWAIIAEGSDGTQFVNHQIKLLGRKGVMDAVLICEPSQLEALRPTLDKTLAGFEYADGNKYAEFQEGDKIAEYGLKGLIVGGGLLAAGKLGFFALIGKFFKQIVIGVVAVGAFFVKMKNKIFGSKEAQ